MTGIVKLINRDKKLVALEIGVDNYSIASFAAGDTLEPGDKLESVSGDFISMGKATLFNIMRNERIVVEIEETYLPLKVAEKVLA